MHPTSPGASSALSAGAASPSSIRHLARPSSIHGHSAPYSSPLQKTVSPSPPSPSNRSTTSHPLSPPGQSTVAIDFASQDATTPTAASVSSDGSYYPRIHPIQAPHIQQQSSYLRHQPNPPRNNVVLPAPGIRRVGTETFSPLSLSGSISSSGSSSALSMTPMTPSINNMEESARNTRALPPPASSGYFDRGPQFHQHQRTASSQSNSPYLAPEPVHPQPGQHTAYSSPHPHRSPPPAQGQQLVPIYGPRRSPPPQDNQRYPGHNRNDRTD